jgi:predicted transcriptional regulator
MVHNYQYNKVASILLKQNEPIKIEKLSLLSSISISELREILRFFASEGFLKNKDNFDKIELTLKAKQ